MVETFKEYQLGNHCGHVSYEELEKVCFGYMHNIAALERERDELQEELHQKLMYSGGEISRLEADNALLMKRLEVACHVKADDKVGFDFAILDKMDALERERDEVRNIVKFLEERLRHYYKVMEKRYNRIEDLESENALLRKRMEPIEQIRGILSNNTYFLHAYAMYIAIVECMEGE